MPALSGHGDAGERYRGRISAGGTAGELHGIPIVSRSSAGHRGSRAGRPLPGWRDDNRNSPASVRLPPAAFAGGHRLPHADRLSVRPLGWLVAPVGGRRHGMAHPHGTMDSGTPRGAVRGHLLLLEGGQPVVRVGVAVGRVFRLALRLGQSGGGGAVSDVAAVGDVCAALPVDAAPGQRAGIGFRHHVGHRRQFDSLAGAASTCSRCCF